MGEGNATTSRVLSQEERTVLAPPDQLLWHGISVLGRRQQARQKTCPAAHALLILATLLLLAPVASFLSPTPLHPGCARSSDSLDAQEALIASQDAPSRMKVFNDGRADADLSELIPEGKDMSASEEALRAGGCTSGRRWRRRCGRRSGPRSGRSSRTEGALAWAGRAAQAVSTILSSRETQKFAPCA